MMRLRNRKKNIVICCALRFCVSFFLACTSISSLSKEEIPELYARSAVLMDGYSGRILYAKNGETALPMASTTKIMTCITALENAETDLVCQVSENAASQPKVKLGMRKGERYHLTDLLYSLMLESHNDTAVCIAEAVAGSVEEFAELMNQKAKEIGCKDTWYITPNGLDAENETENHHSTAEDLALVMRYCVLVSPEREKFLEITQEKEYTFSNLEGSRAFLCKNHNTLLQMMEGVISGKTGYTSKAGYCYVGAVEQNESMLIVALLGCGWPNNRGYKWVDTQRLISYGRNTYKTEYLKQKYPLPSPVAVEDGQKESVHIIIDTANRTRQRYLIAEKEQIQLRLKLVKSMKAPVAKGEKAGYAEVWLEDFMLEKYPVVTIEHVKKRDFCYWFAKCVDFLLL